MELRVKRRVEPKVVNLNSTWLAPATAAASQACQALPPLPLGPRAQAWCPMVARGMKVIVIMMWYFLCDPAGKRPGKCWRSVAEDTDWDQLTGTHERLTGGPLAEILREQTSQQRAALPHPTTRSPPPYAHPAFESIHPQLCH